MAFDISVGAENDKTLPLAIRYLPYLGTNKFNAKKLKQEFYKLGLKFSVSTSQDRVHVKLSGLNENLKKGVELFEHLLANVVPDAKAYKELIAGILKSQANAKLDKSIILRKGLINIAKYGMDNPFKDILSAEQLETMNINKLTAYIRKLSHFKHQIFYYGPSPPEKIVEILKTYHKVPPVWLPIPPKKEYERQRFTKSKVYFVPYDMRQVEIYLLASDTEFTPEIVPVSRLFNEYFGSGLSSITFQEIREKRALAYSAYSWYSNAREKNDPNYLLAYLGTQSDKLDNAVDAMKVVLNKIPRADLQFEAARNALLKKIESSRTIGANLFWRYEAAKKRGLDYDINRFVYKTIKTITFKDLSGFFNQHAKGKKFALCIVGNEKNIDLNALKRLGQFKKMTLKEVFGY